MEGPWRTTPASAVRRGRYKLVHFFEDGRSELYDLQADVSESRDLAGAVPEVADELLGVLEGWWRETGAFVPTSANPGYQPDSAGG